MIQISRSIALDDNEVLFTTTRSGGAGGQHVNTTDSAVILRFDAAASPNLPEAVKHRLVTLAGSRMTRDGILLLRSEASRSQYQNKEDALARLVELVHAATIVQAKRRPTKPGKAAKARRVDGKTLRGKTKALRGKITD